MSAPSCRPGTTGPNGRGVPLALREVLSALVLIATVAVVLSLELAF